MIVRSVLLIGFVYCIFAMAEHDVRVMTFNIWLSGAEVTHGLQKIAKHIALVNPDIVALQEVEDPLVVSNLTSMLGPEWSGIFHRNRTVPDVAILTKHQFHLRSYTETNRSVGIKITLKSGILLNFWSLHLDYRSYGPYAAYNKLVTSIDQIKAGESPTSKAGRAQNMEEIKDNHKMEHWREKVKLVPMIVAGDFNCPSHLDWTEENKDEHGGWAVSWPATQTMYDMGFTDSFRELHPDVQKEPGYTWSTVNKFNREWDYTIPEPQDRIDFIFYQGSLKPIRSFTYAGSEPLNPMPHHKNNDYPSDHYAVVTEFEIL